MNEWKNIKPKKQTVNEIVKQMRSTAFNARKLAEATDIVEEMIKDDSCKRFLGLSGAMVPAGMRMCVVEMIRRRWIDIIVSTGANITHDIAQSYGEEYIQCDPNEVKDLELRKKGYDRIYDVASRIETMTTMEKYIQKILNNIPDGEYSTFDLLYEIGKRIDDSDSIIKCASINKVKIIVPALIDSILGIQIWMNSQSRYLKIDVTKDLDYVINLNFDLKKEGKKTGAFILGGGVPKNFILQSVLVPDKPHNYVVQVTVDTPQYGGLSGATLEEALSWGKIDEESKICTLYCDATIALPLIVSTLIERFE